MLIRFSELWLKGKNRHEFIKKLKTNLQNLLNKIVPKDQIVTSFHGIWIFVKDLEQIKLIEKELIYLLGISYYCYGYIANTKEEIEIASLKLLEEEKFQTFKISPRHQTNIFFSSSEIYKRELAGIILNKTNLKVNVLNPDANLYIEAYKNFAFIFINKKQGVKGLPYGSNGHALTLLSGGIDSPLASFKMMTRGISQAYLTFLTPPYTKENSRQKIIKIVKHLTKYSQENLNLYIINFTPFLNELNHIKNSSYKIILMRRAFIKIASLILDKEKGNFLITGDALGQVASQTPNSLLVTSAATNKLILRPLICYEKDEIVKQAIKIGTYPISNLEGDDVCSMFLPKQVVTNPKLIIAEELEKDMLLYNELIDKLVSDVEQIEVKYDSE